jgi:hypothetical protein
MGAHHAPHSSSPHAARLAGRGAFTAAAALALAGGTASLAFASEAPSVPTTHAIQGQVTDGAHKLQDAAEASPLSEASHASAHSMSSSVQSHGTDLQDEAGSVASTLQGKAPSALPSSLPSSLPTQLPTKLPTSLPSGVPTSLPSGVPTSLPSGVPTSLPSGVPTSVPTKLPTSLPTSLPASSMKADTADMAHNTVTDVQHAATNMSAASKDGFTPADGAKQVQLASQDVKHGLDNGKNALSSWSGALSEHAPQLPASSVLSFG